MQALRFDPEGLRVVDTPRPSPGMGEVLVRVSMAGICSTDLQITRGYMNYRGTLGHEFVGSVVEGADWEVGTRVVGEINFACRRCAWCKRGLDRHCPHRTVLGIQGAPGCFAEYVIVPAANLHKVPDKVSDQTAVFVEPVAAAFEILEQTQLEPNTRCVVFGDGKLGQVIAQVLHSAGHRVTAVGKYPEKLKLLTELGIPTELFGDYSPTQVPLVVEATGSEGGFEAALASVEPRGSLVLKSTVAAKHTLSLAPLVIHEISVIGSRCGPFAPALDALASGKIQVRPMISNTRILSDGVAAIEEAARSESLKVLLDCQG
ncbi:MAG: alcohol dehydrogenase catalytic domain-containing protein [Planctomycetes bacterium]|nr:alcohol dehydrogenase catalytic domain-containing protein [Planctomycetota bacterium]